MFFIHIPPTLNTVAVDVTSLGMREFRKISVFIFCMGITTLVTVPSLFYTEFCCIGCIASCKIPFLNLQGKADLTPYLAWFVFAHDGVRIAYATVDTIMPIFLSCFFAGSAGSSPTSSQNATLPSSSAWPLSASGYSSSFSSSASAPSVAGTINGLSVASPSLHREVVVKRLLFFVVMMLLQVCCMSFTYCTRSVQ